MDIFFPFIYEKKQKEKFEPVYLYIEEEPLPPIQKEEVEEVVISIDLF